MIEQTRHITCDHCKTHADLTGLRNNQRPPNWSRIRIPRNDNSDKHTWKTHDLCPECATEIRAYVGESQPQ